MYRVQMKNSACVGCVHLLNFHLEAPFSRYISFLNICKGKVETKNSFSFVKTMESIVIVGDIVCLHYHWKQSFIKELFRVADYFCINCGLTYFQPTLTADS